MENREYWVWLSKIEGLGSRKIQQLLNQFQIPENIWKAKKSELLQVRGIGEEMAYKIQDQTGRKDLSEYLKQMEKHKIEIIPWQDAIYPKRLAQIYDPPMVLFIKGNKDILNKPTMAMVGCRDCTEEGKQIAKELAFYLAKHNMNIISGLAKGIDTYSHVGCLLGKGKTIAVLGNGIDSIYPRENEKVAQKIVEMGGSIISEYGLGVKPERMHFPARNRIISGLSNVIIVVEAKLKSGSMITVDYALEQGKDVLAIPGSIKNRKAEGTNYLIKQGARMITCYQDVLEDYPMYLKN